MTNTLLYKKRQAGSGRVRPPSITVPTFLRSTLLLFLRIRNEFDDLDCDRLLRAWLPAETLDWGLSSCDV